MAETRDSTTDDAENERIVAKMRTDKKPASKALVVAVYEGIMEAVGKTVRERFTMSDDRIAKLEQRIAQLEARPVMRYMGVFREGEEYEPGAFATHDGGVWHANRRTGDRPGTSNAWTLAVKSARR
jgi:hypothetical protein